MKIALYIVAILAALTQQRAYKKVKTLRKA